MYPARVAWAAAAARDDCTSFRRTFATWRCTVCSLRTSDEAISRFESPAATRRSTSVSRRLSGDVAVRLRGRSVVEEPRERPLEVALVVMPRQMGVARESDEAGVREERRELPAAADRHRAVTAAVQHERRRRHRGQVGARVRGEIELEERRGDVGVRRVALVAAERLDLLAATRAG